MGKKFQIELSDQDQDILARLQEQRGGTVAAVFREALSTFHTLAEATSKGGEVFVQEGETRTKVISPSFSPPPEPRRDSPGLFDGLYDLYSKGTLPVEFILALLNQSPEENRQKLEETLGLQCLSCRVDPDSPPKNPKPQKDLAPRRTFWKTASIESPNLGLATLQSLRRELRGFRVGGFPFEKGRGEEVLLELRFSYNPEDRGLLNILSCWAPLPKLWFKASGQTGRDDNTFHKSLEKDLLEFHFQNVRPKTWAIEGEPLSDLWLVVQCSALCTDLGTNGPQGWLK